MMGMDLCQWFHKNLSQVTTGFLITICIIIIGFVLSKYIKRKEKK